MSVSHDIQKALYDAIGGVKKGSAYSNNLYPQMHTVDSAAHKGNTPVVAILPVNKEVVVACNGSGYDLKLLTIWLGVHVNHDRNNASYMLNTALDDLQKLLYGAGFFNGSALHAQAVRCRMVRADDYYWSSQNNIAGARLIIEIIYYEARA